jgi:hypothetical protein
MSKTSPAISGSLGGKIIGAKRKKTIFFFSAFVDVNCHNFLCLFFYFRFLCCTGIMKFSLATLLGVLALARGEESTVTLELSAANVHWGFFSKEIDPVITIPSETVMTVEMATHHVCVVQSHQKTSITHTFCFFFWFLTFFDVLCVLYTFCRPVTTGTVRTDWRKCIVSVIVAKS